MNSSTNILDELKNGILTDKMDLRSSEYADFKLLIKSKVQSSSKDKRIEIAILGLKFEMEDYLNSNKKNISIGSFIKKFINAVEIKQVQFAEFIGVRPSNLSKILNGERRLNLDLALILEYVSKIKAESWLMIQNRNEIFKMRKLKRNELAKYKLNQLIK